MTILDLHNGYTWFAQRDIPREIASTQVAAGVAAVNWGTQNFVKFDLVKDEAIFFAKCERTRIDQALQVQ